MSPMRRFLPLLIIPVLLAVPAAASARVLVGISDQQAFTFSSPLYAPLNMKVARYITPYDVVKEPIYKSKLDGWLAAAQAANQRVLVAFEHSYRSNRLKKHKPSVSEYTSDLKAFHKAYPQVKEVQAWNEANRCQRSLTNNDVVGQPICHDPKKAAQYYMAARKVFRGAKVTGLDILDQNSVRSSVAYVKRFLRYAHPRPKYWGIHNYSDTNRFSTARTKALVKATRSGEIWLTETGGIVKFGGSFPYSPTRAAKALGCMFTTAKVSGRITRLYVYQFTPAPSKSFSFDAGLINPNGTKRPGWTVVQHRKARRCHK